MLIDALLIVGAMILMLWLLSLVVTVLDSHGMALWLPYRFVLWCEYYTEIGLLVAIAVVVVGGLAGSMFV